MAYVSLMDNNSSNIGSATVAVQKKSNCYTPAKSIKQAFKVLRKLLKKSVKHQKFLNESSYMTDEFITECFTVSNEECQNLQNEQLEAAQAGIHTSVNNYN